MKRKWLVEELNEKPRPPQKGEWFLMITGGFDHAVMNMVVPFPILRVTEITDTDPILTDPPTWFELYCPSCGEGSHINIDVVISPGSFGVKCPICGIFWKVQTEFTEITEKEKE